MVQTFSLKQPYTSYGLIMKTAFVCTHVNMTAARVIDLNIYETTLLGLIIHGQVLSFVGSRVRTAIIFWFKDTDPQTPVFRESNYCFFRVGEYILIRTQRRSITSDFCLHFIFLHETKRSPIELNGTSYTGCPVYIKTNATNGVINNNLSVI